MKLVSWNVNGFRAVAKNGFLNWFAKEAADVVALQEIKVTPDLLPPELLHPIGYESYWHPAEKPGYSGVALFCKKEPVSVRTGIGDPLIDREGRVLIAEWENFFLINTYFPNSGRDLSRLPYKLEFCKKMLAFCDDLRKSGKNLVLCGDYNIAHKEIDLKNPKTNQKNAGFLPQERAWMDEYLKKGYVDCFRHFEPGPGHYTWWSYRPGVRDKNIGWRIDYHTVNPEMKDRLKTAWHEVKTRGSDHCPVGLEIKD